MCIVSRVIQFVGDDSVKKSSVMFKLFSDAAPSKTRFALTRFQLGNKNMKAVRISAALVMDNTIAAVRNRPNQTLARKLTVSDNVCDLPRLPWFCEPVIPISAKSKNGGWQVCGGMDLMEA